MAKIIDITGSKIGKLKVLGFAEPHYSPSGQKVTFFQCLCDCGNFHTVRSIHLRRHKITSCGNCDNRKHGESNTLLYGVWNNMRFRVTDKYFQRHLYFDKGITVCEEWQDYIPFSLWAKSNGYGKGLQLDRVNNNIGYCPENCRWVTAAKNSNNRDVTFKVYYKGVEYAFTDLIDIKGLIMYAGTIRSRIARGWSVEDAFDKPIRQGAFKRKYFNNEDARNATYKRGNS